MDKEKAAKVLSITVTCIVVGVALLHLHDWEAVGIYKGCGLIGRVLYPLHHANLLHAGLNAWCLLSVVFIYDVSVWRMATAYIIAISIPSCFLYATPTVGLSGVVFALFGSISFEVKRKAYYQLWMIVYLVLGFLFPNTNAWVHLYCYLAGVVVALLNKPIKIG